MDVHIRSGLLVDGLGSPARRSDVLVSEGRIVAVGAAGSSIVAERVIDATGKVVAPGFIDQHQHGDITPLVDGRCLSALAQGVTSIIVGNCGHGIAPRLAQALAELVLIGYRADWGVPLAWSSYGDYFSALRSCEPAVNIGVLAAHGAIRMAVIGSEARAASDEELGRMRDLVSEAIDAGALGISTGLEYSPGRYADAQELRLLCEPVGEVKGMYASHIRSRGQDFVRAVNEAIGIAEHSGVGLVLSHLAPRPYAPKGVLDEVLAVIDAARIRGIRVTLDTFPDVWGPSPLASLVPPDLLAGSTADLALRLRDPAVRARVVTSFERRENHLLRAGDTDEILLSASAAHPEHVGRTLAEIGSGVGRHPAEVTCDLLADDEGDLYSVLIQHRYSTEQDLLALMQDDFCAFESDGVVACADGRLGRLTMNRSTYGYAPRVLGELVRERRIFSLEEAVRKMTSLPADTFGLSDRGRLVDGAVADIVVFDPTTVGDRSTDRVLQAYPVGIDTVIVGGRVAFQAGEIVSRTGTILRRIA